MRHLIYLFILDVGLGGGFGGFVDSEFVFHTTGKSFGSSDRSIFAKNDLVGLNHGGGIRDGGECSCVTFGDDARDKTVFEGVR